MNNQERHEARYQRRKAKRLQKRQARSDAVVSVDEIFSFNSLYRAGLACCSNVRWKRSTQNFETRLISNAASARKALLNGEWKPGKYHHFTLCERGKSRPIDAPHIKDRQVEKVITQKVLLPLYLPSMIHNNGASIPGKGYEFSKQMLKRDLRRHYLKYGTDGKIIQLDFKQYFPSAKHDVIYERHNRFILNDNLRDICDAVVRTIPGGIGMPLGVEPSQAEMIAYPSDLDNYIKCQLGMKHMGHYMDDYYIIVPPDKDAKAILSLIIAKAAANGLTVNLSKTKIVPVSKPFKYCKAKYRLTETGRVVVTGSRDSMKRARRKLKTFHGKIARGEMTYVELWEAINSSFAYFERYNDHKRVLKLRRIFYSLFWFSPEKYQMFVEQDLLKQQEKLNELYRTQTF